MHVLAVCGVISAALYVAIRLGMRFYFRPKHDQEAVLVGGLFVSVPYHHIACTAEDRFCGPAALTASLWEIQSHHTPDILARSDWRLAFLSLVLVRDLPKSAKDMLVVEFTDLEIGSAAERY
jgi:hypothetical protein